MSADITKFLDRPIAYHRSLVPIAGCVTGAIFLSQALYWSRRTGDDEGWFFKTQAEWEEETGLGRREQESARKALRAAGVLTERMSGLPARLYFRVNLDHLGDLLAKQGWRKTPYCDGGKRHTVMAENANLYKETETTTETTSENSYTPARKRADGIVQKPSDVDDRVWSDFLALRKAKRALLTETALAGIAREATKAGITLDEALRTCCERGWQGFKAEWASNGAQPAPANSGGQVPTISSGDW